MLKKMLKRDFIPLQSNYTNKVENYSLIKNTIYNRELINKKRVK